MQGRTSRREWMERDTGYDTGSQIYETKSKKWRFVNKGTGTGGVPVF